MLDLRYGNDVPTAMVDLLEHHGRALGLALADLEVAGRDLATAEAFIVAAERGDARDFVRAIVDGVAFEPFVADEGVVAA